METNTRSITKRRNIIKSIDTGISIALFVFLTSSSLMVLLGFTIIIAGDIGGDAGVMVLIFSGPLGVGIFCAIIAGIWGGLKKHKVLVNNLISRVEVSVLQSIANERKSNPAEIQDDEISKWKGSFSKFDWMEEIGKNTQIALINAQEDNTIKQEHLLCVTYADAGGSHITEIWFNQIDLSSRFISLIATTKGFFLVNPEKKIVRVIKYKNIRDVEHISQDHTKIYTIYTVTGDTAKIHVQFDNKDEEAIVDVFFERITSVK